MSTGRLVKTMKRGEKLILPNGVSIKNMQASARLLIEAPRDLKLEFSTEELTEEEKLPKNIYRPYGADF